MKITQGRIVLYTLTELDATEINRRRTSSVSIRERIQKNIPNINTEWPLGAQAHIGNAVGPGQTFPMIVTWTWPGNIVNGQVFLDGNDCFWATSISEGNDFTRQGRWVWPPR
jgi:hypothetical protein